MRKLLKILLLLVLVVIACAAGAIGYLYMQYPNVGPPEAVTVQATPEKLARGQYLANHVTGCVPCHSVRDFKKYGGPLEAGSEGAGGELFGEVGSGFEVYSKNITPQAIGTWSDGELIRAFTAGVNKDGEPLFPIMPYPRYARLSRDDVESIVAYVRTLKPAASTIPERKLPFPLPLIVRTMPQPAAFRSMPAKTDRVAYGEYMTNAAACADCHTPTDDRGQPLAGREFAGGMEFVLPGVPGSLVRSANITPDADSGIGTWTEQQFIEKFKAWEGQPHRDLTAAEQRENTIMPWLFYSGMTNEDLSAMYAYLRTLKPVVNRVTKFGAAAR